MLAVPPRPRAGFWSQTASRTWQFRAIKRAREQELDVVGVHILGQGFGAGYFRVLGDIDCSDRVVAQAVICGEVVAGRKRFEIALLGHRRHVDQSDPRFEPGLVSKTEGCACDQLVGALSERTKYEEGRVRVLLMKLKKILLHRVGNGPFRAVEISVSGDTDDQWESVSHLVPGRCFCSGAGTIASL